MKYSSKRIISAFLVLILVFSSIASTAYAASGQQAGEYSFLPSEPSVIPLSAVRSTDLEGEEAVYFGALTAQMTEGDKYYSFPVYREGSLETEASVTLLTVDVSALYGADYELCAENVFVSGQEHTLLEKQNGGANFLSDEELTEEAERLSAQYEKTGETETEDGQEKELLDVSSYSMVDEIIQTATAGTEFGITEEEMSDALRKAGIDYSAGMVLHFAPGETEKTVMLHLLDDELEEGEEVFQFLLTDAVNTVIRERYNYQILIKDNEEHHDSLISFDTENTGEEYGKVKVTVNRTGSEYALIEYRLVSGEDTAVEGVNYQGFNEILYMQPYQTKASYEFEVTGSGRMNVFLIPETSCEVDGNNAVAIEFDVQETEEELEAARAAEQEIDDFLEEADGTSKPQWETVELLEEGDQKHSFNIKINDGEYKVVYTGNTRSTYKGKIMLEVGKDEVQVGDYYFSSPEMFDFNIYYGYDTNSRSTTYHEDKETYHNTYARLDWHNGKPSKTGGSRIKSSKNKADFLINSSYYRYAVPDWQSDKWQNCGQHMYITLHGSGLWPDGKTNDRWIENPITYDGSSAEFSRRMGTEVKVNIPYSWQNRAMQISATGGDSGRRAPWTVVRVYGFALMYKVYEMKVSPYSGLSYQTAGGNKVTLLPCSMTLQAGREAEAVFDKYRTFYPASDDTTMAIFAGFPTYLNGHTGIFGKVNYFQVVYNPSGGETKSKTLYYPEKTGSASQESAENDPLQFAGYLRMKAEETAKASGSKGVTGGVIEGTFIDYSASKVEERIAKAKNEILTVNMDRYMLDWLAYVGALLVPEDKRAGSTFGTSAVQLSWEPVFGYQDVEVTVWDPKEGKAHFSDEKLTVTSVTDKPHVFHAGDTLDMTVVSDKVKQNVSGYEYSLDKGVTFTPVSSSDLFLEGNWKSVIIRPLVSSEHNCIEVRYLGDAEKHIEVQNLIDPDELEDTDFEDMHILEINHKETSVYKIAKPEIGGAYKLNILVKDKPAEADKVYRPYIMVNGQKVSGLCFPLIAKANAKDNVVSIGVETVKAADIKKYKVTGNVEMEPLMAMLQKPEARKNTPVAGYVVMMPGEQGQAIKEITPEGKIIYDPTKQTIYNRSITTDQKGCYKLEDVPGIAGDIVPLLITSNVNDGRVAYVRLQPDGDTVKAGTTTITYPVTAPEVTSVMYAYDKSLNNYSRNLLGTEITIYNDDTLHLYFTLNEKYKKAEKVNVIIQHYNGDTKKLEAKRVEKSDKKENGRPADIWQLDISNMPLHLSAGDKLYVAVVDSEGTGVYYTDDKGQKKEAQITYPMMYTGLKFTVEQKATAPMFYKVNLEDSEKISIPVIGDLSSDGSTSSGMINWKVGTSEDNKSYYFALNISGGYDNIMTPILLGYRANQYKGLSNNVMAEVEEKYLKTSDAAEVLRNKMGRSIYEELKLKLKDTKLSILDKEAQNLQEYISKHAAANEIAQQEGSNPQTSTVEYTWNISVSINVVLTYMKMADGQFHYAFGNLCIGIVGAWERTKFTMFMGTVPGYWMFGGHTEDSWTGIWRTKETEKAMTNNFFEAQTGNIVDLLATKNRTSTGRVLLGFTGYIGAGVGLKNVFSPRGVFTISTQFGIAAPKQAMPERKPGEALEKWQERCAQVKAENQNGQMVTFQGGVEMDLLVTTLKINVASVTLGWGAYKDQRSFNIFGWKTKFKSAAGFTAEDLEAAAIRNAEVLRENNEEVTELVEKLNGTSDMSSFGKGIDQLPGNQNSTYAEPQILLNNAADSPYIQTVQTGKDGSMFMVFAGNRGNEESEAAEYGNDTAIYYTQYNAANGNWTIPQILDKDSCFDATPKLTVYEDKDCSMIVTVSWTSAEEEFTEKNSQLDKAAALRIKTAVFRITDSGSAEMIQKPVFLSGQKASDSVAKKEKEAKDEGIDESRYMDSESSAWYIDGKIYSYFTRYELGGLNEVQDMVNYYQMDPRVYFAVYDAKTKELVSLDPLDIMSGNEVLYETSTQIVQVEGESEEDRDKTFVVFVYTQDTDGNGQTEEDFQLKLGLIELQEGKEAFVYPSMDISWTLGNSNDAPGAVRDDYGNWLDKSADPDGDGIEGMALTDADITEANGSYYLTYLKDGYLFEICNIGEYLDSMFAEDYLADMYRARAEESVAGTSTEDWFKVDVAELNQAWAKKYEQAGKQKIKWISSEDLKAYQKAQLDSGKPIETEESILWTEYEGSLLEAVSTGQFGVLEGAFGADSSEKPELGGYQLVSDGAGLYAVYSKRPANSLDPYKELFCVKINPGTEGEAQDSDDSEIGYSVPVQLTNAHRMIEGLKASMKDGVIQVISNCYDQAFSDEKGIVFGPNSIAVTNYKVSSLLKVDESAAGGQFLPDPETGKIAAVVNYNVINTGLVPQQGYKTWVKHNGEEIFRAEISSKATEKFETDAFSEEEEKKPTERILSSCLDTGASESFFCSYPLDQAVSEDTVTIYVSDLDGKNESSYQLTIESEEATIIKTSKLELTEDGYEAVVQVANTGNFPSEEKTLILEKENEIGEDEALPTTEKIAETKVPVLKAGESTEVKIPLSFKASDFTYGGILNLQAYLNDNEREKSYISYVADSPEEAVVEGQKTYLTLTRGTSRKLQVETIPQMAETGNILYYSSNPDVVSVDENGVMTCQRNGAAIVTAVLPAWGLQDDIIIYVQDKGSDDEDSNSVISKLPSYVDQGGSWKQDADGNWTYTTKAGVKAADKWLAIARSTFNGGDGFEWYRFDKNGIMVTGWFRDSDDRMYYLQAVADGNKGRMLTGWQLIDKNWYYFETASNGYKGEMYRDRTTPDKYYVRKDGTWDGKKNG